jgi:catalase
VSVTPVEVVDAANRVFGRHPGSRALHAKGILLAGTFAATRAASSLTTAVHMQGEPVAVTARFSNSSGHPQSPDYLPDLRGLAVKFYLPDGSRTDLVTVSTPLFVTRTPEVFTELLETQGGGAAAALKLPLLLARHPRLARGLARGAKFLRPAASFAALHYWGQHAFRWTDGQGRERFVRYTFVPSPGDEPYLGLRAARARGADYLQDELRARLATEAIRFGLEVEIAEPGDPVDDASLPWPPNRQRVRVGDLVLSGLDEEREQGHDVLVFDPTRVTPGVELSGDPVLAFRSPAYRESVARRTP